MSTRIVTTADEIKSRKASRVMGDDLRELTAPMRDTDGKWWPRGTQFRPISAGHNGVSGQDERTIHIIGD